MRLKQLENIRTILADPSSMFRKDLKTRLIEAGMKNILDTGNLGQITRAVEANEVDLIIADTALHEGSINDFIHDLRHNQVGNNPFIATVTMVSKASTELVRETINSGTDKIIVKPFEIDIMVDQVLDLTLARKKFVVTTDYIGPDRRAQPRPGVMQVPRIEVPNPLRQRMTGQMRESTMRRSIDAAWATINEQKVERYAYQIGWLLDRIIPEVSLDEKSEAFNDHTERLIWISQDMSRRIKKTKFAHVREMTMTLANMAVDSSARGFLPEDVRLLLKLSELISDAFSDDHEYKNALERRALENDKPQDGLSTGENPSTTPQHQAMVS